jgi:hypothetical protein
MSASRTFVAAMLIALIGVTALSAQRPIRSPEASFEILTGDGVTVTDTQLSYTEARPKWEWRFVGGFGTLDFDYRPNHSDIFGFNETVNERRVSADLAGRYAVRDQLELLWGIAGYDGFTNYRSAWINNWYQQFFDGLGGLEEADPYGFSGRAGLRWEYVPGGGFLRSEVSLARDKIAPAYDEELDEFGGLLDVRPLRSILDAAAWSVSTENVLSRRLRTLAEYRIVSRSTRELRHSFIGRMNIALGDSWRVRLDGGVTLEDGDENAEEDFLGWWIGGQIERQIDDHWSAHTRLDWYEDNGEIENAIGFSSSAPGVRTGGATGGVRFEHGLHAVVLEAGWRIADYGSVGFRTQQFSELYVDRGFFTGRTAYSWSF